MTYADQTNIEEVEAEKVYYHDCPVLGKHTIVPRAVLMGENATKVLGFQRKCIFCGYEATKFEPNNGEYEIVEQSGEEV